MYPGTGAVRLLERPASSLEGLTEFYIANVIISHKLLGTVSEPRKDRSRDSQRVFVELTGAHLALAKPQRKSDIGPLYGFRIGIYRKRKDVRYKDFFTYATNIFLWNELVFLFDSMRRSRDAR